MGTCQDGILEAAHLDPTVSSLERATQVGHQKLPQVEH